MVISKNISSCIDKDRDKEYRYYVVKQNPKKSKHLETANVAILGYSIDFVNLRTESYSQDSRIPQVTFGTPQEGILLYTTILDSNRRDLTINSLYYNIHTNQIEDYSGKIDKNKIGKGLQDLKNRVIRTPLDPYITFKDDPLRMLRCIRLI